MERMFFLEHNKGFYSSKSLSEIFFVMYTLHAYDKHDVQLPDKYSAKWDKLRDKCYLALLDGQKEYRIGKFKISREVVKK